MTVVRSERTDRGATGRGELVLEVPDFLRPLRKPLNAVETRRWSLAALSAFGLIESRGDHLDNSGRSVVTPRPHPADIILRERPF